MVLQAAACRFFFAQKHIFSKKVQAPDGLKIKGEKGTFAGADVPFGHV